MFSFLLVSLCSLYITVCSASDYKYRGLLLLQSQSVLGQNKAINFTLAGQVEFKRFLTDALYNCRASIQGSSFFDCPKNALLNQFTHACCDENYNFMHLNLNSIKLDKQEAETFLNLLNTRIDDSFQFTSDVIVRNEMILIFNMHHNNPSNLIRTFTEIEYPGLQNLLNRYHELCLIENTEATESESCPRVNSVGGLKFCCDYSDQLLYSRLG